ncbi:unnamed protein product [Effrenium voratum]|nr:unnamed protein product [Effrenium voratum]
MAETGSPYARVPQDAQGTGVPSAGAGAPSPRLSVGEPSPRRSSVSSWRGSESEVPGSWQPEEAEAQPSIVRNVSEYFQVKPVLIYRLAMAVAVAGLGAMDMDGSSEWPEGNCTHKFDAAAFLFVFFLGFVDNVLLFCRLPLFELHTVWFVVLIFLRFLEVRLVMFFEILPPAMSRR